MGGSNSGEMRLLRLFRTALICSIVWLQTLPSHAQLQQLSAQPQGTIRVSVNRVNVGVIVTDAGGHFIEGLRREDFHVFDNSIEQPITDFLPIEEPAQLVLLMECGPAAYFVRKSQLQAADTILTSLSPADRVAISSYSRSPELLLDFTPDKTEARLALRGVNFTAGFSELNLSSSVATTLDWLAPLQGKKTILLLSTGVDTSSPENWKAIQQ